jgi:hypothetical protein
VNIVDGKYLGFMVLEKRSPDPRSADIDVIGVSKQLEVEEASTNRQQKETEL